MPPPSRAGGCEHGGAGRGVCSLEGQAECSSDASCGGGCPVCGEDGEEGEEGYWVGLFCGFGCGGAGVGGVWGVAVSGVLLIY